VYASYMGGIRVGFGWYIYTWMYVLIRRQVHNLIQLCMWGNLAVARCPHQQGRAGALLFLAPRTGMQHYCPANCVRNNATPFIYLFHRNALMML
jgi:hypothetical protein